MLCCASRIAQHGVRARCSLALHLDGLRDTSGSKTYLQVYQTQPAGPTKWPTPSSAFPWATSRSRSTNSTGYISTISLSSTGAPIKQLFLEPTTSSGWTANSVAPAPFSDEWAALTDSSVVFVQVC